MKNEILLELAQRWEKEAQEGQTDSEAPCCEMPENAAEREHIIKDAGRVAGHRQACREHAGILRSLIKMLG